jgi:hypothetical protein
MSRLQSRVRRLKERELSGFPEVRVHDLLQARRASGPARPR